MLNAGELIALLKCFVFLFFAYGVRWLAVRDVYVTGMSGFVCPWLKVTKTCALMIVNEYW